MTRALFVVLWFETVGVAVALFFLFLLVPNEHPATGLVADFSITEDNSAPLRRNMRLTNVTAHPDRVALWLPHATDGGVAREETTCCQYVENGAHWVERNEPYRIYQAPTRQFVTNVADAAAHWETQSGGYRILGSAVESGRIFDDAELARIDTDEVNFVARANLTYLGDGNVLAVARLVMDRTLKHIFHWGIIVNSVGPNICDAIENAACHDEKALFVHEVGHVYGLDDLYAEQCENVVMYGYLETGETMGRQLDAVTRQCVRSLYGNLPLAGESVNDSQRTSYVIPWPVLLHILFELLMY